MQPLFTLFVPKCCLIETYSVSVCKTPAVSYCLICKLDAGQLKREIRGHK